MNTTIVDILASHFIENSTTSPAEIVGIIADVLEDAGDDRADRVRHYSGGSILEELEAARFVYWTTPAVDMLYYLIGNRIGSLSRLTTTVGVRVIGTKLQQLGKAYWRGSRPKSTVAIEVTTEEGVTRTGWLVCRE